MSSSASKDKDGGANAKKEKGWGQKVKADRERAKEEAARLVPDNANDAFVHKPKREKPNANTSPTTSAANSNAAPSTKSTASNTPATNTPSNTSAAGIGDGSASASSSAASASASSAEVLHSCAVELYEMLSAQNARSLGMNGLAILRVQSDNSFYLIFYAPATKATQFQFKFENDFEFTVLPESFASFKDPGSKKNWSVRFPNSDDLSSFCRQICICKFVYASSRVSSSSSSSSSFNSSFSGPSSSFSLSSLPSIKKVFYQDFLPKDTDKNGIRLGDLVKLKYTIHKPAEKGLKIGERVVARERDPRKIIVGSQASSLSDGSMIGIEDGLIGLQKKQPRFIVIPPLSSADKAAQWSPVVPFDCPLFIEVTVTSIKRKKGFTESDLSPSKGGKEKSTANTDDAEDNDEEEDEESTPVSQPAITIANTKKAPAPAAAAAIPTQSKKAANRNDVDHDVDEPVPFTHSVPSLQTQSQSQSNSATASPRISPMTGEDETKTADAEGVPKQEVSLKDRMKNLAMAQFSQAALPILALSDPGRKSVDGAPTPSAAAHAKDKDLMSSPASAGAVSAAASAATDALLALLNEVQLGDLLPKFHEQGLHSVQELFMLENDEWKDLVPLLGPRKRLIHKVDQIKSAQSANQNSETKNNKSLPMKPAALDSPMATPAHIAAAKATLSAESSPKLGPERTNTSQPAKSKLPDTGKQSKQTEKEPADSKEKHSATPSKSSEPSSLFSPTSSSSSGSSSSRAQRSADQPGHSRQASAELASAYERGRQEVIALAKEKIDAMKETAQQKFTQLQTDLDAAKKAHEDDVEKARNVVNKLREELKNSQNQLDRLTNSLAKMTVERDTLSERSQAFVSQVRQQKKEHIDATRTALEALHSQLIKQLEANKIYDGHTVIELMKKASKNIMQQMMQQ